MNLILLTTVLFVFLLEELLPDAEAKKTTDGRLLNFSKNPNDRAIAGASSGGICAFTAAWERPEHFVVCLVLLALL